MALSKEQVENRRTGVGGSDAAAVCGLDDNRTRLNVWEEKLGIAKPFEGNLRTELGNAFEDPIVRFYAKKRGVRVARVNETLRHPKYDFMLAHIDRRVIGEKRGVEAKLRSSFDRKEWGESGSDQVPTPILMQVQHYMAVMDYPVFDIPVAFGTDWDVFTVEADKELQQALIEQEHEFWKHVLSKAPPPPQTLEDVKKLYTRGDGPALVADQALVEAWQKMVALKAQIEPLEKDYEALELMVKTSLQDAAILVTPDGKTLATWKSQSQSSFDISAFREANPELAEAFTHPKVIRRFLLKEPKQPKAIAKGRKSITEGSAS